MSVEPRNATRVPLVKNSHGETHSMEGRWEAGSPAQTVSSSRVVCEIRGSEIGSGTTITEFSGAITCGGAVLKGPWSYHSSKSACEMIGLPYSRAFCAFLDMDAGSPAIRTSHLVLDTPVLYSSCRS